MKIFNLFDYLRSRRTRGDHKPAEIPPSPKADLEVLAIERLVGLGTERGNALALEIERGRQRRQDRLH